MLILCIPLSLTILTFYELAVQIYAMSPPVGDLDSNDSNAVIRCNIF
jgi:hypothetical protein